jgi:NAD(P)-dependent dehydrogenase (short-subunit alcohol dehydrogenase family)
MRSLVIGGTKGIGRATSALLRKNGHEVLVAARDVSEAIQPSMELDLRDNATTIKERIESAIELLGGLDWLVISAGQSGMYASPHSDSEERARMLVETNFLGRQQALKAAARHLLRARGKAVVVTTDANHRKAPGLALYKASHSAMEAYATELGMEYAGHGVAINVVAPGWVESEMTEELPEQMKAKIIKRSAIGRMIWCSEIAEVIHHLLQMPHVLTGAVIPVTGGFQ